MAAKKKTKKKPTRSKSTIGRQVMPKKKLANRSGAVKKKSVKKKPALKKAAAKNETVGKKIVGGKTASAPKKRVPEKSRSADTGTVTREGQRPRSGVQSGDLQGLSNEERADSESVDELLEEGNTFEADVVAGVENAGDTDEKEVRTHEVPEDDVPGEYLDEK
jgi:hypothetical protein